jgi:8-oxo-dGTP diphosphatase
MIECTFESGDKATLRHTVVDGMVFFEDKLILVRRSHSDYTEPGKLCLPGGYIEKDEIAKDAIIREVLEETGYKSSIEKFLGYEDNPKRDQRQNISLIFELKVNKRVQDSDNEVEEIIKVSLNNLPPENQFAFDHYNLILKNYIL